MSAVNDTVLKALAGIGERCEVADVMERTGFGHRVVQAALESLVAEDKVRQDEVGDVPLFRLEKGVKVPAPSAPAVTPGSARKTDGWRHELVAFLRRFDGCARPAEIREGLSWTNNQYRNRISTAKKEGLIEARGAGGAWGSTREIGLPGVFSRDVPPPQSRPRRQRGPGNAHQKIARSGGRNPVIGASVVGDMLKRDAEQAQAALDQYVVACCDPQKLAVLKAHRDAARAAVQEFAA